MEGEFMASQRIVDIIGNVGVKLAKYGSAIAPFAYGASVLTAGAYVGYKTVKYRNQTITDRSYKLISDFAKSMGVSGRATAKDME